MAGFLSACSLVLILNSMGQFHQESSALNARLRADPLLVVDKDGAISKIAQPIQWPVRRAKILLGMEAAMGPFPAKLSRSDLAVKKLGEPVTVSNHSRQKISFEPSPGTVIKAWLLVPLPAVGQKVAKFPAMLCLHQTIPMGKDEPAGLGVSKSKRQAFDLADRGFVCLAPDYPSFGEYPCDFKNPAWQSGTMLAIWNNSRAVDLLCSLPEVDAERIGAIGHSLGGHNTLFTAVFEPRIKVAVTSCGFTSFPKYMKGDLTGWTSSRYMPRIATIFGKDPAKMPFDFPEVLAAIAPRGVFVNAPKKDDNFGLEGVIDSIAAARPVFKLLNAENRLQLRTPEGGHDFQEESRLEAYAFVHGILSPPQSPHGNPLRENDK